MQHYKFERTARNHRRKAFFLTLAFHLALLCGLAYSGDIDLEKYFPEEVKEWLGMEEPDPNSDTDREEVIRP